MSEEFEIILVDDHPLLRKGLRQLVEMADGLNIVAEAGDGESAIQQALELDPDLILLDLNMQGMNGLDTLSKLRDAGVTAQFAQGVESVHTPACSNPIKSDQ